jgi:sporulation protein YlmC with PRC-barrel domain
MEKFNSISALHNRKVVDRSGEFVGRIHDVLIDLRDGRIEYICIALRDAGVSKPTEVVVPWSAIRACGHDSADWEVAAGKALLMTISQPVVQRS